MNLTDAQIKQIALESVLFRSEAEKQRPDLFRTPFKNGDWIIHMEDDKALWKVGYKNFEKNNQYDETYFNKISGYRLATNKEIISHLKKEFWKRYDVGDKIQSLVSIHVWTVTEYENLFTYYIQNEVDFFQIHKTHTNSCTVYKNGEWAVPIKKKVTLDEYKEAIIKNSEYESYHNYVESPAVGKILKIIETFEKQNNLK